MRAIFALRAIPRLAASEKISCIIYMFSDSMFLSGRNGHIKSFKKTVDFDLKLL
jgi:hypothetical protein